MKILVIGDTHGQLNKIREIFPKLTNLDLIAHTGDHLEDGHALEREFGIPVVAVKGNCDGSYSADDFEIIETDYGRILLTHGHMQHVNYRLDNLYYKAMEENCKAVFFGHTHKALVTASTWSTPAASRSQGMTTMDPMLSSAPHRTVSRRPSSIIPPLWAAAIKTGRGQFISAASSTTATDSSMHFYPAEIFAEGSMRFYKNVKNGQHLSLIDNGRCPFYLLMDLLHHPGLDDHDNKRDYI